MKELRYYKDNGNNYLLAYERSCEFFVRYLPATDEWETCPITFSNFLHDYNPTEVSRDAAYEITGGNLPEELLEKYLRMLARNLGGN